MVRQANMVPYKKHHFGDGILGGLSPFNNALRTGCNSGFQALNLAVIAGAEKIILLGYDMKFDRRDGKTTSHWHGGHPEKQTDDTVYRGVFTKHFEELPLPERVRVFNATPGSNIKRWGYTPLEEALQ